MQDVKGNMGRNIKGGKMMGRKKYVLPYKMIKCLQEDEWENMRYRQQIKAVYDLFYMAMGEVRNNMYYNTTPLGTPPPTVATSSGRWGKEPGEPTVVNMGQSGRFVTGMSESGNFYTVDEDYC